VSWENQKKKKKPNDNTLSRTRRSVARKPAAFEVLQQYRFASVRSRPFANIVVMSWFIAIFLFACQRSDKYPNLS
jgi:hypothetical protein